MCALFLGFEEKDSDEPQNENIRLAISIMFLCIPIFCVLLSSYIKWKYYPLTDKMTETKIGQIEGKNLILQGIDHHKRGEAAKDPLTQQQIPPLSRSKKESDFALESFPTDYKNSLCTQVSPKFVDNLVIVYCKTFTECHRFCSNLSCEILFTNSRVIDQCHIVFSISSNTVGATVRGV